MQTITTMGSSNQNHAEETQESSMLRPRKIQENGMSQQSDLGWGGNRCWTAASSQPAHMQGLMDLSAQEAEAIDSKHSKTLSVIAELGFPRQRRIREQNQSQASG